jgi:hypothetical protein
MPNIKSWEKAMAGRLKEFTNIDPFTIDQTQYSEKSDSKFNHPYITMVNKEFPMVLIDENGRLFNGNKNSDQVDCKIIHPQTHFIDGRPHWLFSAGNRKSVQIEQQIKTQYPLLILAYRNNEFDKNGIPADVIEIIENKEIPSLVLDSGEYEIVLKDSNYDVVDRYGVRIE